MDSALFERLFSWLAGWNLCAYFDLSPLVVRARSKFGIVVFESNSVNAIQISVRVCGAHVLEETSANLSR